MSENVEGQNNMKVIHSLRSEVKTQTKKLEGLESTRRIPEEVKVKLIGLLRAYITVVRNTIAVLEPLSEKQKHDGE
jgi:hypothetical protein|tara:strand:- start:5200 stop:5427 length:228 start_codon:yes stop_codon:yes gene_type:complete